MAPDFDLQSEEGEKSLAEYKGQWVVLYFYPKDFTSGCTQEACDFRDALANSEMNAAVLGISPDDVESHQRFKKEHNLNFLLLADEDSSVARKYDAYGNRGAFGEGVKRSTFIIDEEGKIAKAYYNVKAAGHAQKIAEDLEALQS